MRHVDQGEGEMGEKIVVNGRVLWESPNGERRSEPDKKPDTYGFEKITVDGQIMWEGPSGEREIEP
jgi:hypothetical protein